MPNNVPLSQVAYERIKKGILSLQFPPGFVLQERSLAELLGMSRTPVREAIHTLMRENWLSVAARSHSRVRAVAAGDIEELYEVRFIVETGALSLLAERGLMKTCVPLLEKQHRKMEKDCNSLRSEHDLFAFIELDRDFHSTIYRTLGNARLQGVWNAVSDEMVWYGMMAMVTPERFSAVLEEHGAVIESLRREDFTAISTAVRNHLNITALRIKSVMEKKRMITVYSEEETE